MQDLPLAVFSSPQRQYLRLTHLKCRYPLSCAVTATKSRFIVVFSWHLDRFGEQGLHCCVVP